MDENVRLELIQEFMECVKIVTSRGYVVAVETLAIDMVWEETYRTATGGVLPEGVADWREDRDRLAQAGAQVHRCLKAVDALAWSNFYSGVLGIPRGEEEARLKGLFQNAGEAILMAEKTTPFLTHVRRAKERDSLMEARHTPQR